MAQRFGIVGSGPEGIMNSSRKFFRDFPLPTMFLVVPPVLLLAMTLDYLASFDE